MNTLVQLRSGELNGVTRFALSEGLTVFPQEIYQLSDSLEILDLSGNKLTHLPNDLHRLSKLKILFASNNQFESVPECLAMCSGLEMIGFKGNQIASLPENALPINTRWLILTDNCLESLPSSIGKLKGLQKLMLAGNRLKSIPDTIALCESLQLVRLSANQLNSFPEALLGLPRLAWLAYAGNPFCTDGFAASDCLPEVSLDDLVLTHELGSGASGVIWGANWKRNPQNLATDIAVKIFKGYVTSDGYVIDELKATLAVGKHQNLVAPLAKIANEALVLALIPAGYVNLGCPPCFNSCTRDTFTESVTLAIEDIAHMVSQLESTLSHIHNNHLCHGDIYAHNVLLGPENHLFLSDFGAASPLKGSGLTTSVVKALKKIEYRALAFFILDLLSICDCGDIDSEAYRQLSTRAIQLLE